MKGGFSLATTTLLQRHANEGESIAEAIRDCLDYGKNPEKTEDGKYISSYECDPATVAAETAVPRNFQPSCFAGVVPSQ